MPDEGASSEGNSAAASWREDPVASGWATSVLREPAASIWGASVLRRLFACHICLAFSKAEKSRVFVFLHTRMWLVYACGTVKIRPQMQPSDHAGGKSIPRGAEQEGRRTQKNREGEGSLITLIPLSHSRRSIV
jgi:hypothetical protein